MEKDVIKKIGKLTEGEKWNTEFNLISWNGAAAKYDIRKWNDEGKCTKGVTLTSGEVFKLYELLKKELDNGEKF